MPGKRLCSPSAPPCGRGSLSGPRTSRFKGLRGGAIALWLGTAIAQADSGRIEPTAGARFLGVQSCSSTGCHGGAAERRDEVLTWSRRDVHTRAYATLTTARSARMAEALKIGDPGRDLRCTSCHAPLHGVPAERIAPAVDVTRGVSCESCHGPAEPWLRSHTRSDFTHDDRVSSGLRDLKNLYVRANVCVACHQNVEPALLAAGHPELMFELDGQCVSEPRHWRERPDWHGPQAWLIGQAAAFREMSWELERLDQPDTKVVERWQGLLWVLKQVSRADAAFQAFVGVSEDPVPDNIRQARQLSDQLARDAAALNWSTNLTRACLQALSAAAPNFRDGSTPATQARRAERLVLALERLWLGLPEDSARKSADEPLDRLFKSVQSLPAFDPAAFGRELEEFRRRLQAR